jgi:GNAT superfamily N-acetyltransferase
MASLEVQPVVADTPLGNRVNALYTDAFPRVDKFAFDAMCRFAADGGAEFSAYLDDGEFCGFSYVLKAEKYLFVLYLAVEVAERSKGYGSRVIDRLKQENPGMDLVLDIELPYEDAPNAEQRYRRRAFYERNGFWCTGDVFGVDDNLYLIMTTAEKWDREDFMACAKRVHGFLPDYYFGDIHHFDDEVRKRR